MSSDGIDIAIAQYQMWAKFDLPARIQKPYNIVKDDPIPAGHPYWLKEIDRKQCQALGVQDYVVKPRVLGFHPKIVNWAKTLNSYVVEPVDEEHRGAGSASSAASAGPPAASGGPPPPPPPPER